MDGRDGGCGALRAQDVGSHGVQDVTDRQASMSMIAIAPASNLAELQGRAV